tara:strand:- start:293 stop:718 length:426 start_codon:yes stop_codon:yes gene_type:complete
MLNFFKKDNSNTADNISIISITSLLIHAAKIDENYTDKEKIIIKDTIIKLGYEGKDINEILNKAENIEKDSNQILEFTKEAKNLDIEKKKLLLEALWTIIYSDKSADLYETNLMRRLSGLLYLDNKVAGDIKEKVKTKLNK